MKRQSSQQVANPAPSHSPLLLDTADIPLKKHHRCIHCKKLLGVEHLLLPALDIKCVRCGHINSILNDQNRQVIITDQKGVILYINEHVSEATGYSAEEILGQTPAIWGSQMSHDFYTSLWNDVAVLKKAVVVKVTNKHKNGTLYPVILRISPILDISGNVEFFIGMETLDEEVSNTSP